MNPFENLPKSETSSCQLRFSSRIEIVRAGGAARALLEHFFNESQSNSADVLPRKLENWIFRNVRKGKLNETEEPELLSTTFQKHGRILIAHLTKSSSPGEYSMLLVEDQQALEKHQELERQLTRRQFEMYHHFKDGERDISTIARKMGISVRTAEGHKMNLKRVVADV